MTSLSRRTLERRTPQLLGHCPKEEITRIQLERARRLLAETQLKVAAVAADCGFAQAKYFCQVFRGRFGITPAAFRRKTIQAGRPTTGPSTRGSTMSPRQGSR
jgi:LacI family transcriptional regulator